MKKLIATSILVAALVMTGCGSSNDNDVNNQVSGQQGNVGTGGTSGTGTSGTGTSGTGTSGTGTSGTGTSGTGTSGGTTGGTSGATPAPTQVEFLARPAIAEGLLFTQAYLKTYNAVTPAFVAAALANPTGPEGTAAAPVFGEAITVLNLTTNIPGGDANPRLTTAQIVGAFLPDVMRIDTTLNVPVANASYAAATNASGSVVGGRKLTDDTIDITLTVITNGAVKTDGVPYYRPAGNTNESIGHQRLNGQTVDNGPATFPFLAPAN